MTKNKKTTRKNYSKNYAWLKQPGHRRWLPVIVAALIAGVGLTTAAVSQATTTTTTSGSILKPASTFTTRKNLRYSTATTSNRLLLDLYTPNNDSAPDPVVVWIHGGGWNSGSKDTNCAPYVANFMKKGFAVACINYRLSNEAKWPAQLIDVKTAIRSLRANAATYKLYPDKIGVWGASAGGHLAAMAGTTGNAPEFNQGNWTNVSSSVQAVRDDFGPTDMVKWVKEPCCAWLQPSGSFVSQLFSSNTPILNNQAKAATANPINYINGDEPPISIWHGDKDPLVPLSQSQLLHSAMQAKGMTSGLQVVPGMGHGDQKYYTTAVADNVASFFDGYLRP